MTPKELTDGNRRAATDYLRAWTRLVRSMNMAEYSANLMYRAAREGAFAEYERDGELAEEVRRLKSLVGEANLDAISQIPQLNRVVMATEVLLGIDVPDELSDLDEDDEPRRWNPGPEPAIPSERESGYTTGCMLADDTLDPNEAIDRSEGRAS